ncbi:putative MFS-type transporter like protein [Verticillium longisporum]|uniref:Major facilitator superfamily (MFS) profile domain-containing protein n=3 Tax=Verticillium TaxID=1036719 RepID=G2XCZ1_VERDV|nr:uncharacterized protein VDAG_08023 [Verticillium dahliae VdLs.17]KAF3345616.1 hypothetical protein VdG2_06459 [Verticillium dahliae VDG2]KAG7108121.1 putative MFS-type transporter like protein [Verticillium longisporum]KAH6706768.1 major facilitator superfamily domain-containing protein [Verticillium dahliae]EGY16859.1 hypothetical protein VDAG_08023 [Verticillium dahliae VdLs.17]KAG7143342.1 putative MFS-type transporter like protein [Verticillium longisporum]
MASWREAFALSKSQVQDASPPGTVEIFDVGDTEGATPNASIVLFPKPSADPRDPLNLPTWRRIAALLTASIYAFVANYLSSLMAPSLQMWPAQFPNDPQPQFRLTRLIAVNILMLGASNIWWVPLSNWAGRRPVLIIATLMMTVCSVWGATATSYNSLLAARIFQGAGGGASETVAPALVGDMFFAHERGRAMAVYTIFLAAGATAGGLSGGYIAFHYGWDSTFWVSVALAGFCFLTTLVFVPESLFDRAEPSSPELSDEKRKGQAIHEESHELVEPVSLVASLGFRRPTGSLVDHFTRPWRALLLPGTWVVTLHYAGLVGGIVTISTVGANQMAMPPYSWGANAGLVNIGGLVGVVLGYIYTYVLSDARFKKKAKVRGHGMSEAEDRLPLLAFPLALSTCGFFVFGFCAQYPGGTRWVGLQVGFAMLSFGLMQVPSIGFNYLIDAYTVAASDCFTVATIIRSCIAFAWTFFVSDWEHKTGPAEPFGIFGMLMGLFSLTTIPLWLYGKRLRIVTAPMIQRWM